MPDNNSNLSNIDGQQTAVAAKRKEDNTAAAAQAIAAIAHQEQEALIAIVAAARKTLDETRGPRLGEKKEHRSSPITTARRCPRDRTSLGR
jgi:hypothetical protein